MPDLGSAVYPDDFDHARMKISDDWGLDYSPDMQDWDLCNADARLLPQIQCALQGQLYSPAERFAIVELALSSMDLRGTSRNLGISGATRRKSLIRIAPFCRETGFREVPFG